MNIKGLIAKGQLGFERNKGLIFTLLSAGLEIAAVIAMAKQAPKAEKILAPANRKIEKLKDEMADTEAVANHLVYPEDNKKEIKKIQRQTFVQLAKVYALPVIFTSASLAFMGGSYKVMRNKQIALGAAYVTLDNAFKQYRSRVKEKFGEEAENEIFRDNRKEKVITTNDDGKEIEEVITRSYCGGPWEIIFDAASPLNARDGRTNWETLMRVQKQMNIELMSRGYLFLSDVLDELMIPKSTISKPLLEASKIIGWIYDPDDDNRANWVSFGISDQAGHPINDGANLFDGTDSCAQLSFNCDGNILFSKDRKTFAWFVKD